MKMGNLVNWHLNRERTDVALSIFLSLVLMIESGYANAWVYADGNLSLSSATTYLALGRGLFLEVLIFATVQAGTGLVSQTAMGLSRYSLWHWLRDDGGLGGSQSRMGQPQRGNGLHCRDGQSISPACGAHAV